ncbi:hypothetical protein [Microbacterium sp. A93]|uniref:hypothetical protein n=1 Tax=Microbacterium sp. A93 TaxID=3450716 RepID=UPI003F442C6A
MQTIAEPKTHAWDDVDWRDRYLHIVSDDEDAADMLAEVLAEVDQRHPYALCGLSPVCFERKPDPEVSRTDCPECLELNGVDAFQREDVQKRMRSTPDRSL